MRKAKTILAAIIVLGFISGGAAFKAKKIADFVYVDNGKGGPCTITLFGASTTNDGWIGQPITDSLVNTTTDNGPCSYFTIYYTGLQ